MDWRVNPGTVAKFSGELREILDLELAAGNRIRETWEGGWPHVGVVAVSLSRPFLSPIRRSSARLEFRDVDDPHYWKAEYYDAAANQLLVCGFDDPSGSER